MVAPGVAFGLSCGAVKTELCPNPAARWSLRIAGALIVSSLVGLAHGQPAVAEAAEPGGIALDEAVRRAVEYSAELRAAGLRVEASEAAVQAAEGAFDLLLTGRLDWNTSRRTVRFDNAGGLQRYDTEQLAVDVGLLQPLVWGTQIGLEVGTRLTDTNNPLASCIPGVAAPQCFDTQVRLTLTQPLWRGRGEAVNTAQIESARQAVTLARLERREAAEARVEAVVRAWAELAYAARSLAIQRQALELALEQLAATEARIEVGNLAPADRPVVAQAAAARRRAILLAEQALADQRAVLATWTALDDVRAGALPPLDPFEVQLAAAIAEAEAASAALEQSRVEEERLRTSMRVQADLGRPRLDLTFIAAQSGLSDTFGESVANLPDNDTHYYGAVLDFAWAPAGNAAEGEVARIRALIAANRAQREAVADEVRREVGAAVRAVRTAEAKVEFDREAVALAEVALEAEKQKFDSGRATNLDVLQVQQDLANARLEVARAEADRIIARARLQRLTGALLDAYGLRLEAR